jgi:hypothetical protein
MAEADNEYIKPAFTAKRSSQFWFAMFHQARISHERGLLASLFMKIPERKRPLCLNSARCVERMI